MRHYNKEMQSALSTDNYVLETEIVAELKELEQEAVILESKIEQSAEEKRAVLAEVRRRCSRLNTSAC